MGSKFGSGDDGVIADINITPFVDIVLVVLIIFMVTTPAMIKQSIKVNLPDAATGEPNPEGTNLGLTLLSDGGMLLDGEPVSTPQLLDAIHAAKAKSKDDVIALIAADKTVAYGRVMWLVDLLRNEGVAKYAWNIDKTQMIGPDPATIGQGVAP